jgi:hypothetical protein
MSRMARAGVSVFLAFLGAGISAGFSAPTQKWSQGNPTADEQYTLVLINRYRIDPIGTFTHYAASGFDMIPGMQNAASDPNGTRALASLNTLYDQVKGNSGFTLSQTPFALYPLLTTRAQQLREISSTPDAPSWAVPVSTEHQQLQSSNESTVCSECYFHHRERNCVFGTKRHRRHRNFQPHRRAR